MGVDANIENSTSRASKCIAFCRSIPTHASKLVLHVVGDPPMQLGEWPRAEVCEQLGHELDALMADHHEDAGVVDSKFSATYVSEEGRGLKTKTFTVRTRREIAGNDAAGLAASLDGSMQATNALVQQTALAMVRMYLTAQQAQTNAFVQLVQTLGEKVVESESRSDEAREAYYQLREVVGELQTLRDETPEMTPAQQKFFELAGAALPAVLAKLTNPA